MISRCTSSLPLVFFLHTGILFLPLDARKKGDLSGGATRVGGSQGTYIACPCFCDMLRGTESGEGPYWGAMLGVNQTQGATDANSCHLDSCMLASDHDMPFCKPYVEASGGTFCARQFNSTLMGGLTGAAYVTALDQHVMSCSHDTLPMPASALPFTGSGFPPEDGPIADDTIDSTYLEFTPKTDHCHNAIASAACHMAFPKCLDDAEAAQLGPRPVCISECVRERAMCRSQGSGFGSIEQIVKFSCGDPYVDPSDGSLLCSGVSESGEPGSFGIYAPGIVRSTDNVSKSTAVSGFLICIFLLVGFAKWKFGSIEKLSDSARKLRKEKNKPNV